MTMSESSADTHAGPGDVLDRPALRVEPGKVREFARALGEEPAGGDALPVPLTFPVTAAFTARETSDLLEALGIDQDRALHGEQEFRYHRPLEAGMELRGETRLVRRDERQGARGGTIRRVVYETTFSDESGQPVVTAVHTILETSNALRSQP
jgi:hypothetical protein